MKKLIFCDIDDTIKPADGDMTQFTIDTLRDIKEKSEFVLVTGRNRERTEIFAKPYGGSANGGEVFDTEKNDGPAKFLRENFL